jgi:hypothetical protein
MVRARAEMNEIGLAGAEQEGEEYAYVIRTQDR